MEFPLLGVPVPGLGSRGVIGSVPVPVPVVAPAPLFVAGVHGLPLIPLVVVVEDDPPVVVEPGCVVVVLDPIPGVPNGVLVVPLVAGRVLAGPVVVPVVPVELGVVPVVPAVPVVDDPVAPVDGTVMPGVGEPVSGRVGAVLEPLRAVVPDGEPAGLLF